MAKVNLSKTCSIDGCFKPHYGNTYCSMHNARNRKYGSPHKLVSSSPGEGLIYIENVAAHYDGDECLIWPYGRGKDGYGLVAIGGSKHRVPRVICEKAHGAPPLPKMDAAHSCGNGHLGCIAKKHLRWATRSENVADARAHGTLLRGEKSWNAKLTDHDVMDIRARYANGERLTDIGLSYGIMPSHVHAIVNRRVWTHI